MFAGFAIGAGALWAGSDYYVIPLVERPFSPLHDLYSPTGLIGHGLGIVGTAFMVGGVALYSLRKRVPFMSGWGKLKHWLEFHIFLCLLGPFLILLHTTFKIGGLVAISFWSMALVVGSGVFGRYVYLWIPKTVNGRFLTVNEVRERRCALVEKIESQVGVGGEDLSRILGEGVSGGEVKSVFGALFASVRFRLGEGAERMRMRRALSEAGVPQGLRDDLVDRLTEEQRGQHQLRFIHPFQRAFRYWHAFHLPLAVVMILIMLVHVAVAIAFGYTWILGPG